MRSHPRPSPLVTLALIAMVSLVASCGNGGGPTGGGGGGGGAKELNSGDIAAQGGQFPHTFANAGTFNYRCIHHSMAGSVTVATGSPMTASVTITDNAFTPTNVSVAPTGTVTWTNNGMDLHTVTSP